MTQPARPVNIGKPLILTPADLDLAATVTTVDQAVARSIWYRWASSRFVDILYAMEEQ